MFFGLWAVFCCAPLCDCAPVSACPSTTVNLHIVQVDHVCTSAHNAPLCTYHAPCLPNAEIAYVCFISIVIQFCGPDIQILNSRTDTITRGPGGNRIDTDSNNLSGPWTTQVAHVCNPKPADFTDTPYHNSRGIGSVKCKLIRLAKAQPCSGHLTHRCAYCQHASLQTEIKFSFR